MCEYNRDVAKVQCRRTNVEDRGDRFRRADANEVQTSAEDDNKPYGIHWSPSRLVDLAPEAVQSVRTYDQQGKASVLLDAPGER